MAQDYEIARLLYLQAGWLQNVGSRSTLQTSYAKKFATEASFSAANEAIQIHGAYGYSDEYDVERYLRNARGAMIYEGSSEIQTLIQAGYALGSADRQAAALRTAGVRPGCLAVAGGQGCSQTSNRGTPRSRRSSA